MSDVEDRKISDFPERPPVQRRKMTKGNEKLFYLATLQRIVKVKGTLEWYCEFPMFVTLLRYVPAPL